MSRTSGRLRIATVALLLVAALPILQRPLRAQQDPRAWVAESNRHAQVLLDVLARFAPESAGQYGVTGLDEEVATLTDEAVQQARSATEAALATLQALRKTATN